MATPTDAWQQAGGGVEAAIEALARDGKAGALLTIQPDRRSLEKLRKKGLSRDEEGRVLRRAWKVSSGALPPGCVGKRRGWETFAFALAGPRSDLEQVAAMLAGMLLCDDEIPPLCWHLVLTEIFLGEPERTLRCDAGYDLKKAEGKTVLAWVQPYAGPDWKEPQRYPTVTLSHIEGA